MALQPIALPALPASILTKKQTRTYRVDYQQEGEPRAIIATVRHDDDCGNGRNSFSITGELYEPHRHHGEPKTKHKPSGRVLWMGACGCIHEEIAARLPELAPFLKWHLTSADGPMHYPGNVTYLAGDRDCWGRRKGAFGDGKARDLDAARRAAVWPEATDDELTAPDLPERLLARLPALMEAFKSDVESLGLTY